MGVSALFKQNLSILKSVLMSRGFAGLELGRRASNTQNFWNFVQAAASDEDAAIDVSTMIASFLLFN